MKRLLLTLLTAASFCMPLRAQNTLFIGRNDALDIVFYVHDEGLTQLREPVNNGNPEYTLGASDAEELHIQAVYDSGAQTLDYIQFETEAASAVADKGRYRFNVDGNADRLIIDDGGIVVGGTTTLNGVEYTWPGADGSNGDVLTTNGAGTLTWSAAAAGGEWTDTGTILHPNEETLDEIAIGGTTEAGADIFLGVDGTAVFNEQGNDADFRVEGVGQMNALFVRGSDGFVGLGTNSPSHTLHINGNQQFENNDQIRWKSFAGAEAQIIRVDTNDDLLITAGPVNNKKLIVRDVNSNVLMDIEDAGTTGDLSVTGTTNSEVDIYAGGTNTSNSDHLLRGSGSATFNNNALDQDIVFKASGILDAIFLQGSDGFLGLRTQTPAEQLHVVGNAIITGTITQAEWQGDIVGTLYGGTGIDTSGVTNGQLLIGNSTGNVFALAGLTGTANEVDVTNGASSITIGIVDPLIVDKGGTGATSLTDGGILLGSGTGAITALGVAANGEIPIGDGTTDPVLATITGGTGITVVNGAGTITLSTNDSQIDHGGLGGLGDDDHTQYALLAGRSGGQVLKGGTGTTDTLTLQTTSGVGATGAWMDFLVGNDGDGNAMRILNNGLIGMGTTTPTAKLHVIRTGGTTFTPLSSTVAMFQRNDLVGRNAGVSIVGGTSGFSTLGFGDADDEDRGRLEYNHSEDKLVVYVNATDHWEIQSNGNSKYGNTIFLDQVNAFFGVGNVDPKTQIHATANSSTTLTPATGTVALFERNSGANNSAIIGVIGGTNGISTVNLGDSNSQSIGRVQYRNSNDSIALFANGAERLSINSVGDVGIATTSPVTRLDIDNGAMRFEEMASGKPAAEANAVTIYAEDNGSGLTQLVARLPSGPPAIIAGPGSKTVGTIGAEDFALITSNTERIVVQADGTTVIKGHGPTTSVTHTGTGTDDMIASGSFTGGSNLNYQIKIDAIGSPDTFAWSDSGDATGDPDATGVPITSTTQALNNGISIRFQGVGGRILSALYLNEGGLDDMTSGGNYTGGSNLTYHVIIDGTGTPDTFAWSDSGDAVGDPDATGVAITGGAQTLNNGVTVTFGATTGHAAEDAWRFSTFSSAHVLNDTWDFTAQVQTTDVVKIETTDGTQLAKMEIDGDLILGPGSPNQKLTIDGTMSLKEQAAANADTADYGQIWIKNETPNEVWFTDDAGNDFRLGTPGGIVAWDDIADPSGNGAIDMANTHQFFTWDSPATATNDPGLELQFTHDATTDSATQIGFRISRLNTSGTATFEQLIRLSNLDTDGAVTNGILIDAAAGGMTTAIDASDSDITTALNGGDNTIIGGLIRADELNFASNPEVTISTGAITVSDTYVRVDTQADASTDDLDTISGGLQGDYLVLRPEHTDRTVIVKNGTGNIVLDADVSLDDDTDTLVLIFDGTQWTQAGGSAQGGGGSSEWTLNTNDLSPNTAATTNVVIGGTTQATGDIVANATGQLIVNEQGASLNPALRVEGTGQANLLYVDGTNNRVGIGTGSPGVNLAVTGGTDPHVVIGAETYVAPYSTYSSQLNHGLVVRQPDTTEGNTPFASIIFSQNQAGSGFNIGQFTWMNEAIGVPEKRVGQMLVRTVDTIDSGEFILRSMNAGALNNNAFIITRTGNVLINRDSSGSRTGMLEVTQKSNDSNNGLSIWNTGGNRTVRVWADSSNNALIYSGASGTGNLILNSGGPVGINTTSPAAKLEVNAATATDTGLIVQTTDDSTTKNIFEAQTAAAGVLYSIGGTGNVTINAKSGSPNTGITLGAAATTIAITRNVHTITGDAGANTVATITGGVDGQILTLIFVDALVTITDDNTHASNSVDLSTSFTSADDTTLQLVYNGTSWYEVSRSVN